MAKKEKKEKKTKETKEKGLSFFGAGRPPSFKTSKEMQKKINDYFNSGIPTKTCYSNGVAHIVPVPTITGLALFLGFATRQSFYDYEEKAEFTYTVKKARAFMERHYEELLQAGNVTGAIFALKNFRWIDTVTHQDPNGDPVSPVQIYLPDNKR